MKYLKNKKSNKKKEQIAVEQARKNMENFQNYNLNWK
jgi:hypothetical protein